MPARTIPVVLPEQVWGRLASLADNKHVSVSELLTDMLTASALGDPTRPLDQLNNELSAARANGWRVPRRGRKGSVA